MLGLKSRSIDYDQALTQAPIDCDVYMKIPEGFCVNYNGNKPKLEQVIGDPKYRDSKNCIKLKRNLYGSHRASCNWFLHISKGLRKQGFVSSKIDPSLFMRDNCIICLYTDDCLIFGHDDDVIDNLIKGLRDDGFLLTDKGDVKDYLGVRMDASYDNSMIKTIEMKQTGLIDSILHDLGLNKPNTKYELHQKSAIETLNPSLHDPPNKES